MSGFQETIEKLKQEIESHVTALKSNPEWSEVEKIFKALGTIEELEGVPKTSLAELFGFTDAASTAVVISGEFMGKDALEAAKLYMEKKKTVASSLDEILEALKRGGANEVSRNALRTSLGRSTWDVVKAPGQEIYKLVKYSDVKRGGKNKPAGEQAGEQEEAQPESKETAKTAVTAAS